MNDMLVVGPHQDDETFMGVCIVDHVEADHTVWTICMTNGLGSGAQPETGLTDAEFSAARNDEYQRATRQLGVPPQRTLFTVDGINGGALTVARVKTVVAAWVAEHPGGWVKTYSDKPLTGRHPDHIACGKAIRELAADGVISAPRFYVEPWLVTAFKGAHPTVKLGVETPSATGLVQLRAALTEYRRVWHPGRMFGIGALSVGDQITAFYNNPVNHWHV